METRRLFASDNVAGAHPQVLEAIMDCAQGHALPYGQDHYTARAESAFKSLFGSSAVPFFVFNGTGGNVLALRAMTRPYNAILCSRSAHLYNDECGAPESATGNKLITVEDEDGIVSPQQVAEKIQVHRDEHNVQPKVLSISQTTELGTVYSVEQLRTLAQLVHSNDMYLHMDGARFANAVAHLQVDPRAITTDIGVDALSFGGTKNGLLIGEAVIFFNPELAADFKYIRKQGLHLASKMRLIAAQFEALLKDDLWLNSATHANAMASMLAERTRTINGVMITRPVQANAVFAQIPADAVPQIQKQFPFYVWDEGSSEVRWMTSFDTTEEDVVRFAAAVEQALTQAKDPAIGEHVGGGAA